MNMPIQPIKKDDKNVLRFVPNRIVEALLDTSSLDLNDIAVMDFTQQERIQFAQLIGYSISGFGSLSYVDNQTYDTVEKMVINNKSELEARNEYLEEQLKIVKESLKELVPQIFRIHEDDLED